jgi:hypothetical protein
MSIEKMPFAIDEELRVAIYRQLSGRHHSGTGSNDTGQVKNHSGT